MLVLSVVGDGPYWKSALQPLSVPLDCSLAGGFSYSRKYLTPAWQTTLLDPEQRAAFLQDKQRRCGLLAIRFLGKTDIGFRSKLIPLRQIEVTGVDVTEDVQIAFKLGPFVSLTQAGALAALSLEGEVEFEVENPPVLVFDLSRQKVESLSYAPNPPTLLWERLAVDESISPTARANFNGAIVLRLREIAPWGQKKTLAPAPLGKDAETFGFILRAETTYRLDLAYNLIAQRGAPRDPFEHDYVFKDPGGYFQAARSEFSVTGSYRDKTYWILPKLKVPAPIELEWNGTTRAEATQQDQYKLLPLFVPVIVEAKRWSIEKIGAGLTLGLTVVFICLAFWARSHDTYKDLESVFNSLAAFSLATFVGFVKDLIKKTPG